MSTALGAAPASPVAAITAPNFTSLASRPGCGPWSADGRGPPRCVGGRPGYRRRVSGVRYDVAMPPALDRATLLAVIARVEHQLRELERRTGECSLCHSADLRRHLGELRGLLGEARGAA
jgi:hypothetical protein